MSPKIQAVIQVLLFDLGGSIFALKLGAVERILAPEEALPPGRVSIDLAGLLGVQPPAAPHQALLAGGRLALAIGHPAGAARIEAAWILPLPGYMFRVPRAPFRGLIDIPAARRSRMPSPVLSRPGLLLDEAILAEMAA